MDSDFNRAVGGIVIRDGKVLLVRHTYGSAKDKLLIPGGYVHKGEMPEAAATREIFEETGITAVAESILCVRFQPENWYIAFIMRYVSGDAKSDCDENNEAAFFDLHDLHKRTDMTDFSRTMLESLTAQSGHLFKLHPYCSPKSTADNYRIYGMNAY